MAPRDEPVLIYDDSLDAWECRIPYNKALLEEIKTRLPAGARVWKANTKTWVYDNMFIDVIKELSVKYFGSYREHRPTPPPPPPAPVVEGGFYKEFIKALGKEAMTKLYRTTAMEAHPDRNNGNTERMTNLNVNWLEIKKDLGW